MLMHIIRCPDEKASADAWVEEARSTGLPVTALCGETYIPEATPAFRSLCKVCIGVVYQLGFDDGRSRR